MKVSDEARKQSGELIDDLKKRSNNEHTLSFPEASQIVEDFRRIWMFVIDCKLFPVYAPNSLLPKEKNIVIEAFAVCYKYTEKGTDYYLGLHLGYLNLMTFFCEDSIALKTNLDLLMMPLYWQKINKDL